MKRSFLLIALTAFALIGCASQPATTGDEAATDAASLLNAINEARAQGGQKAVRLTSSLNQLAQADAVALAEGSGVGDLRFKDGRKPVAFLSGRARGGPGFGPSLVGYWLVDPNLGEVLMRPSTRAGIGIARRYDGLQQAVVLFE